VASHHRWLSPRRNIHQPSITVFPPAKGKGPFLRINGDGDGRDTLKAEIRASFYISFYISFSSN
jgi:hypothetical protein